MRFAYADPPYVGQAKRHYAKEAAAAGRVAAEVDHRVLLTRLMEYDGWALSLSSPSLEEILHLCREVCGPNAVRVAAWVKPFAVMRPGIWPVYAWEPVIFRKAKGRKSSRVTATPMDWHLGRPYGVSARERETHGVKGSKPPDFCYWLFGVLDLHPEDSLDDLFPGSGGVGKAWEAWRTWDRSAQIVPPTEQLPLSSWEGVA
jgi:hypothetical protein